ncbi:MAG: hypothetical protein IT162_01650 [Bryobacterales bacterium]|nr:hypothetical protein [Bryobacterales bacterium]
MARVAEALAKLAGTGQGPAAIHLPGGVLQVERLPQARLRVTAVPAEPAATVSRPVVETALTWPLVDAVAGSSSVSEVCEVLARYEDPALLDAGALARRLEAYVEAGSLDGQRILDYRGGRGLSANWLAKMYPGAEVVGLEPEARWVELSKRVARERGIANLVFHTSLPEHTGFLAVVMNAVDEEQVPALWASLAPGGLLLAPDPAENRSRILRQIGTAGAGARPVELLPRAENGASPAPVDGGWWARLKSRLFGGDPRAALPELAIRKEV